MTRQKALEKIEELKKFIEELDNEPTGFKNDEIFLLSEREYEKYRDAIPPLNTWWWLRTPSEANYEHEVRIVDHAGNLANRHINNYFGGVRPALKLFQMSFKDLGFNIGDRILKYSFPWIVIGDDICITEVPIAFEKFDNNSNSYDTSHIRTLLKELPKKRIR